MVLVPETTENDESISHGSKSLSKLYTYPKWFLKELNLTRQSNMIARVELWCTDEDTHPHPYAHLAKPIDIGRRIGMKVFTVTGGVLHKRWMMSKTIGAVARVNDLYNVHKYHITRESNSASEVDEEMESQEYLRSSPVFPEFVIGNLANDTEFDVEYDTVFNVDDESDDGADIKGESEAEGERRRGWLLMKLNRLGKERESGLASSDG